MGGKVMRSDAKKTMLNLGSPIADAGTAAVFTQSALGKYKPHDWRQGMPWSVRIASIKRHIALYEAGMDRDTHRDDCPAGCTAHSGLLHVDHIGANAIILQEFARTQGAFDDRYKLSEEQQKALQYSLETSGASAVSPDSGGPVLPTEVCREEVAQTIKFVEDMLSKTAK